MGITHRSKVHRWRWNSRIEGQRIVQQEIPKGAPDWVRRTAERLKRTPDPWAGIARHVRALPRL